MKWQKIDTHQNPRPNINPESRPLSHCWFEVGDGRAGERIAHGDTTFDVRLAFAKRVTADRRLAYYSELASLQETVNKYYAQTHSPSEALRLAQEELYQCQNLHF